MRASGPAFRDARLWQGVYLDLFVKAEAEMVPDATMISMRKGVVLFEREGYGTRFLQQLRDLHAQGPKPTPPDEVTALNTWAQKAMERVRAGGLLGHYRRAEPELHVAFAKAFEPDAPLTAIESLVRLWLR